MDIYVIVTGICIIVAAAALSIKRAAGAYKGKSILKARESNATFLLTVLLVFACGVMLYCYSETKDRMNVDIRLIFTALILACAFLAAFCTVYRFAHQIFLSEEGMAEVTVYGRVKEIAWTEAKAVLPPGMIRSSYILLSDHGDKVAYPKEKNLRDRFLMETGKRTGLGTEFLKKKTTLGRK